MNIAFLLPGPARRFSGGFNVIYEHANRLAIKGHRITLIHTPFRRVDDGCARARAKDVEYWLRKRTQNWSPHDHFNFHSSVTLTWLRHLEHFSAEEYEFVVISFHTTAEFLRRMQPSDARPVYFVQEYEYFMTADSALRARMQSNFRAGMLHVAISPATAVIVEQSGGAVHAIIPNGINLENYNLTRAIDCPKRDGIGFPTRPEPFKASIDAIRALELIKADLANMGGLRIWSYGGKKPEYMPAWIEYHEYPSATALCDLYNRSMIFLTPSHLEGWGLPGCEAMACGAALVSADNGGVHAYAKNAETALIVRPAIPEDMANAILTLCNNRLLRRTIASAGHDSVQQFTWSAASDTFELFLSKAADHPQ